MKFFKGLNLNGLRKSLKTLFFMVMLQLEANNCLFLKKRLCEMNYIS